ncbi:MAG: hypothetical protein JOZ83_17835 [Silvibacterium sp.]|nr:hypothetical protein [Silvibacterium sp.]
MAGVSQKIPPDEVLPLLARNVILRGYENDNETEFLILIDRYLHQARELQALAGPAQEIRTANCADAANLIHILGYQLRYPCGQKNNALVTANPERAFLTTDSGFPLTTLEEALDKDAPFSYYYPSTAVPVLFSESAWVQIGSPRKRREGNLADVLLHDRDVARLYSAMAKIDTETAASLVQAPGLGKLIPVAAVLNFYGSQLCIRSGRVNVPGGPDADAGWTDLVGASPRSPADFATHLMTKDNGWLAVYYDVLARVDLTQQKRLTQPARLKHLYEAYRSAGIDPGATRSVFRKGSELLVLFTRLDWDAAGQPYVPGNLEIWGEILNNQKNAFKPGRDYARRSRSWKSPDQLLEALVAYARLESDSSPLQIYLALTEIDRARPPKMRLSDGAVRVLASKYARYHAWFLAFSEFPELNDTAITRFVTVADSVDSISNPALRGNALGAFQANLSLWQILARQGEIPSAQMNSSWQAAVEPFAKISASNQLFDAARSSLGGVMIGAAGNSNLSQDELVSLLAGPPQNTPEGRRMHREMVAKIHSVLEDQRLASLDTLFALNDGLKEMAHGAKVGDRLLPLAGDLHEFELPRPIFTESEKIDWAPVVYSTRHAELQIRTDLTKIIKSSGSPAQLETARGQLAPFLRDTLVGLNYAYYEPPGAQVLHNNPLFVRSHDFSGITMVGGEPFWGAPELFGVGATAGGGAYLIGSLADLPYALATMEEDFIAPENVQALIWKELVPDLLVGSTLPRWWNVSPDELHAVALYQRCGEGLLVAGVNNAELRTKLGQVLSDRIAPQRLEWIDETLAHNNPNEILPRMLPSETFYLGVEFRRRFPQDFASSGSDAAAIEALGARNPAAIDPERLSRDFGVPHPTLAHTYGRDLLHMKQLPAFGGYGARLFGESWESGNLYWARLADEMGYPPVMLNRLAPELTLHMTARIFATDIEDWPAVLRAMRETGEQFRQGKLAPVSPATTVSQRSGDSEQETATGGIR